MARRYLAVWKYDLFPHYLCGWVSEWLEEGRVMVQGYDSYSFKPKLLLWGKQASAFKRELDDMKHDYRQASDAFDKEWNAKRDDLLERYS